MYEKITKRFIDLIISIPAFLVLSPFMAIIAVWLKIDSRGPAIFKQLRYGKNRVPFVVYKFRTMAQNTPSDVPTNSFKDAHSYITNSGKIIRKLSLDELPQLLNIIKGDMSIVGPRPVVLTEDILLSERKKYGADLIKPGLTGWAQVNGRDELNDKEKAKMDGYYVKNLSFAMDMKCIALTFWVILTGSGHAEGHEQRPTK